MPETPKQKPKPDQNGEPKEGFWGEDQKNREYYYDDAHGYEDYDPDSDEDEEGPI